MLNTLCAAALCTTLTLCVLQHSGSADLMCAATPLCHAEPSVCCCTVRNADALYAAALCATLTRCMLLRAAAAGVEVGPAAVSRFLHDQMRQVQGMSIMRVWTRRHLERVHAMEQCYSGEAGRLLVGFCVCLCVLKHAACMKVECRSTWRKCTPWSGATAKGAGRLLQGLCACTDIQKHAAV